MQLNFSRQQRILRKRSPPAAKEGASSGGLEFKQNLVRLIVAEQCHACIGAGIRGKIEHDVEAGAGSERNGLTHRLEGLAWLTIDRQDHGRDLVEADHHEPRIGGAHDAQPQAR